MHIAKINNMHNKLNNLFVPIHKLFRTDNIKIKLKLVVEFLGNYRDDC